MEQLPCQFCGRPRFPAPRLTSKSLSKSRSGLASKASRCKTANFSARLGDALLGRLVAAGQGRFGLLDGLFQFRQAAKEFPAFGIFAAVGGKQVLDRLARAGHAAQHGELPGAPRRKMRLAGPQVEVEPMAAALVVDLQEQPVLAWLQVEDDGVIVGRDAAGNVLREQLLAVEPHLQPVVAAEAGGGLRGLVRR